MELDPFYVDTVIRRWQQHTGSAAVHAISGKTFDNIVRERGFRMPSARVSFPVELIGMGQIASLQIANDKNLKKMAGSIGWGVVGSLAAGPIGALAGVLAGGNKKEITFICQFKDGRRFLGSCNAKTFTAIQAASFASPVLPAGPPRKGNPAALLGLLGLILLVISIVMIASGKKPQKNTTPVATINQSAANLVSDLLLQDIDAVLVKDRHSLTSTSTEDLMSWVDLGWMISATEYDIRYHANEVSADDDFKGKKILISGVVTGIKKDFVDEAYFELRGSGFLGVNAHLEDDAMTEVAALHRGQSINLVCTGSGRVVTVATLRSCEFFDDYLVGKLPSVRSKVTAFLDNRLALRRAVAAPVVNMYLVATHLPDESACIKGNWPICHTEIGTVLKNKAMMKTIRDQTATMLASLKIQ